MSHRLLFSGQLVERKGIAPFLQVIRRWAELNTGSELEFYLVGDGPARASLQATVLPDNVKLLFIGPVQYNQLPPIYASAGIFVLPTLADTWAVVVNEALASGLPVLGSIYSQAVEEMVEDGKNGWTFCPDDTQQMYAALSRALALSPQQLNVMRSEARARALRITPEGAAQVCMRALRETLNSQADH
jgi:glycosyltransferase involved in cell wall biosynthesis